MNEKIQRDLNISLDLDYFSIIISGTYESINPVRAASG